MRVDGGLTPVSTPHSWPLTCITRPSSLYQRLGGKGVGPYHLLGPRRQRKEVRKEVMGKQDMALEVKWRELAAEATSRIKPRVTVVAEKAPPCWARSSCLATCASCQDLPMPA